MAKRLINDAESAEIRAFLSCLVSRQGWQISPAGANQIQATLLSPVLSFWFDDEDEGDEDIYEVTEEGVAIIPVHGVLVDSPLTWWMSYLGYSSTPQVTAWVKAATEDANVKKVFLDVDSPGGEASGIAAASDAVFALRDAGKPCWVGARMMCSAAFRIGSQADRRFLTADGEAGCDGTLIGIGDWSGYYKQMGVEKLRITNQRGRTYKGAGMMGTVITKEQREDFERICDEHQELFDIEVSRGLGIVLEEAQNLADGRTFIGKNAVALGIVDEIADPQTVLARMGTDEPMSGATSPVPPTDPVPQSVRARSSHMEESAMDEKEKKSFAQMIADSVKAALGQNRQDDNGTPGASNDADKPGAVKPVPAESDELKQLRAFHAGELENAKKQAKATAVSAYGQGSDKLKRAEATIDRMTDVQAVRDYAGGLEDLVPENLSGNGQRQTQGNEPEGRPAPASGAALSDEELEAARNRGQKLQQGSRARVAAGRK